MKTPCISVVMPTHNRADLLCRSIESVLKQTFSDFELLIVSDGSTDGTKEVVSKYEKKDSRVKFYEYFPSKGGNVARNVGIENAIGKYIAFIDDDDEWLKQKLQLQVDCITGDSSIGLVYTSANIIYEEENIIYQSRPNQYGDLSKTILLENFIGTTSSVLLKRDIVHEVGMFDINLQALQDYEFWIRICQKTKIGFINAPMINYYNVLGRTQVSGSTLKYEKAIEYINAKHEALFNGLSEEMYKQKKRNEMFLLGNKAMRNSESKNARNYMKDILVCGFNKKALVYFILSFLPYKYVLKLRSIKK